MKFRIVIQPKAKAEAQAIFDWITTRSPSGAARWSDEYIRILECLAENPLRFGFAPEAALTSLEVREATFRTRRGKRYRTLFVVRDREVFVLAVRGPGQEPVAPEKLEPE